jgi:hypothetical protein
MYHAIKRKHTDKYKENIFMGLYDIVQNIFEQVAPRTSGQTAGFLHAHETTKNSGLRPLDSEPGAGSLFNCPQCKVGHYQRKGIDD